MEGEKKLARIDHERCNEFSACTYVWVRADMTEDEFTERVLAAQREYLAALDEFAKTKKPETRAPYSINWENHRDRNVADVLDEHAARRNEQARFDAKRNEAMKDFDHFLKKQEGIESFWDGEADLHGEVDWGHRHGSKIDYSDTLWPTFRLIKAVKRGAPGGTVTVVVEDEEWL